MNLGEIYRQRKQTAIDHFKKAGAGSPPGSGASANKPGSQLKEDACSAEGSAPLRTFHGYDIEETLKNFDLNMKFGPSLGMSRLERWERAQRMGLNPPHLVKQILGEPAAVPHCVWEGRV